MPESASKSSVSEVKTMANPSPARAPGMGEPHRSKAEVKLANSAADTSKIAAVSPSGPRRLVRPILPARAQEARTAARHAPLFSSALHAGASELEASPQEASHAETFYLQKQAHGQTPMVFVLDDGEQIEGYIEWYDRNAIKVRHGGRTLIYKSCIKYLYKAGDGVRL
jgi:sRNA-binding regulator protein Hfq